MSARQAVADLLQAQPPEGIVVLPYARDGIAQ